ncbi:MAG: DUF1499 domain-containing protein [Methylophaga sp.]|nr:DUF1499 domain-containing protein [Methylophaga sp.]
MEASVMKIFFIILSCIVIAVIIWFFIQGAASKQGKALGLIENNLASCPDKPNCVCSEHKDDTQHYISPITLTQNTSSALLNLKKVIDEIGGTVQTESDGYLAATFTSALFGFVDDLEIKIDARQHLIHLRSASRVGHSDMGINKKRVELLKQLYKERS